MKERVVDTSKCGTDEISKKRRALNYGLKSATCQQARANIRGIQACEDYYKEFRMKVEDV